MSDYEKTTTILSALGITWYMYHQDKHTKVVVITRKDETKGFLFFHQGSLFIPTREEEKDAQNIIDSLYLGG